MKKSFVKRVLAAAMAVCMVLSMWVPASAAEKYTLKLHITEEGTNGRGFSFKPNSKKNSKIVVEAENGSITLGDDLTDALVLLLAANFEGDAQKNRADLWQFESDAMGLTIEAGLKANRDPANNDDNTTADTNPWLAWINTFASERRITGDSEDLVDLLKSKAKIGNMEEDTKYVLYYEPDNTVKLNPDLNMTLADEDPAKGNTYIFTLTLVRREIGVEKEYPISVGSVANGTATTNVMKAKEGDRVTITATADAGYVVSAVKATERNKSVQVKQNSDGTYFFIMPDGPVIVEVKTKAEKHTVKVENVNNGSAEVNRNNAQEGETVIIWPSADRGYEVEDVTVTDATGAEITPSQNPDGSYSFTMPAGGVTVGATTKPRNYNVRKSIDYGTIESNVDTAQIGDLVTFIIRVASGRVVDTIKVIKEASVAPVMLYRLRAVQSEETLEYIDNGDGSISVIATDSDIKCIVTTRAENYAVKVENVTNGSATTSQNSATAGEPVTITPEIDDGYVVDEVTVTTKTGDDVPVTPNPDGTYGFDMEEEDVEITVTTKPKEYSVHVIPRANGDAVTDKSSATAGQTVTITPSADDGYVVHDVKVTSGGQAIPAPKNTDGVNYSFEMPVGNVEVTVITMPKPTSSDSGYHITVNEVTNGNATPSAERADEGDRVTITPSAYPGHEVVGVTVTTKTGDVVNVTEENDGTYDFVMQGEDVNVTVTTKATEYDVLVKDADNGKVTTDVENATVGETVTITASADKGHEVTGVKVTQGTQTIKVNTNDEGKPTFTMPAGDVTVTLVTEPKEYTVTVDSGANGNFKSDAEFGTATMGEMVTITGNAALGYEVETVTVTFETEGTSFEVQPDPNGAYSFEMLADDVEVIVTTKEAQYPINVYYDDNSYADVDVGSAKMNDEVTIEVSADTGYEVKIEVTSTNGPIPVTPINEDTYTVKMPPNAVDVAVTTSLKRHHITVENAVNANPSVNMTQAVAGETVTIDPKADLGYEVNTVKVACGDMEVPVTKNSDGTYSFEMPVGDVMVTLTTRAEPDAGSGNLITVDSDSNAIASADVMCANKGKIVTVTANANTGYEIVEVKVTSGMGEFVISPNADGKYPFEMPDDEVTVTVTTKAMEYGVTVNPATNAKPEVDMTQAAAGKTVTITPKVDPGYEVKNVKVTCGATPILVTKNVDGTYTFPMPAGNVTVDVTAKVAKYDVTVKAVTNGTASVDKAQAQMGETVTITTTTDEGYVVNTVIVKQGTNSVAVTNKGDGKYTFTMPAGDVEVTVTTKTTSGGGGGGGGGSTKEYAITVDTVTNGTAEVDATSAEAGKKVTITVTANEGYEVDTVKVTQGTKSIDVTDNGDGTYSFTMPAGAVTVAVTTKVKPDAPVDPYDPSAPGHSEFCHAVRYSDVDLNAWYHRPVCYVLDKGLMTGYDAKTFGPNNPLSRAMVAQIFYNMEGQPKGDYANQFPDVEENMWYRNAISWAYANGVVSGYGDGLYRPNKDVSREELVQIFCNYAKAKGWADAEHANLESFEDDHHIADWHEVAVQWGVGAGLLGGKGGNLIAPRDNAIRAEAAQMLMNFCEKIRD